MPWEPLTATRKRSWPRTDNRDRRGYRLRSGARLTPSASEPDAAGAASPEVTAPLADPPVGEVGQGGRDSQAVRGSRYRAVINRGGP